MEQERNPAMTQNPPRPGTPGSRGLEIVSNPGTPAAEADYERRRLPRLNLGGEQFRLQANGKIFAVCDLNAEGMAVRILDPEDLRLFPVAARVEGTLNLQGDRVPVKAQVRHVRVDRIGCQFTELNPSAQDHLRRFLDPVHVGGQLKPLPVSEGSTIWYHGPSGTDLLFWRGVDGQFRRAVMHFLGQYVTWESDEALATGLADPAGEHSEVRGVVRFETLRLHADEKPDPAKLQIARQLLQASSLPEDLRKWCLRRLAPN
jgi:hypothetical protein